MVLKLPSTYGIEYSNDAVPQKWKNFKILGASNGQFAKNRLSATNGVKRFLMYFHMI